MNKDLERHQAVMTLERIEANANLTSWCVHILGPDDVLAAPTHQAAVERSRDINRATHMHSHGVDDVLCFAYAAPWPYDKDSHAENLKDWDQ